MKHKTVLLTRLVVVGFLLMGMCSALFAQNRGIAVKGSIVDTEGLPVIGASVLVKGTTTGVAADMDGKFELTVPGESTILEVSALGYVAQEVKVGKQRVLNIVLREDSESIEATVVVAYGTQTKATVTGALTSIDSKALVKAPVADVTNVLAGQMPGVTTVQLSGQPGEDYAEIYIRGVSSLSDGASTPLILVDGVERSLNTVDPNEIESLSILKDAASTAVFGVRGANGVIIVTTKRGDAGKPKISLTSITGVQVPLSFIKQASSYEYSKYYNVFQWNDDNPDPGAYFTKEAIEAYRTGSDPLMFPNQNWTDLMFRKSFLQTKNNINISGGSENVRYFVSLGYMFQNGLLKQMPGLNYDNNYSYDRYNYRANLDFKLTGTTDMKFNISGVIGDTREPIYNASNIWMRTMLWSQAFSSPGIVNGFPITQVSENAVPDGLTRWNGFEYWYGYGYQEKYKTSLSTDMTITQRLDFLTEGLSVSLKGSYGTDMYITKKHKGSGAMKQTVEYKSWKDGSGLDMTDPDFDKTYLFVISGSNYPLSYDESTDNDKDWYLEARVDYKRKFAGKHSVSGLLLYNQSRNYYPSSYDWLPRGYVGWVGRATYSYADKYMVDVSAGYNGSENFAPGKNRYGLFPSISLGWVASEEKFIKKLGFIDFLKLRASIGKVGNDLGTSSRFMYMEGIWTEAGSYPFGVGSSSTVPRYSLGTPGNPGVTWETSTKGNVGLDLEMFNSKLRMTVDLFKEHRTGILISPNTLPGIIATSLPNMNLGKVDNKGYEIEIGWRDNIGAFRYDINANVTFARNKIIYMDEVEPNYEYQRRTGGSTGRYSLFQFERLYQYDDFYTDQNGVYRVKPELPQPNGTVKPGDAMYKDLNGDGIIDDEDQMIDGYPNRPEYLFGSNWKFGYKGFSLNLNWIAATNVCRVYNEDYRVPFTNTGHRGLLKMFAEKCWLPENCEWTEPRTDGTLPRMTKTNYKWNAKDSTLWTVDASYIRLKSASFGYTFTNGKLLKKLGVSSLGIMFTGYNLLTFSKMKLQDPEAKSSSSNGEYPLVKTYNMSVNINF